ncbi:MAG: hypothetical protein ACYTXY_16935, partial [Nostoc sp.]
MSKHQHVFQQKRQTLENLAIEPTNLSLSAAPFSNGEIYSLMKLDVNLCNNLKSIRTRLGMSQQDL